MARLATMLAIGLAGCTARSTGEPPSSPATIASTTPGSAIASEMDPSDPVAARLVAYLRLLRPGGGSAAEIARFLRQNPTWPNQALLAQRLDQAIGAETDTGVLGALCGSATLLSAQSLRSCAGPGSALAGTGTSAAAPSPALVQAARSAWVSGIDQPAQEAAFLQDWGRVLTAQDQWRRLDRLEWGGNLAAAQRTVPLLAPSDQPLAIARLALRHGEAGADGIAAALQGEAARDPALVLDLARWLRRQDRENEALSLWTDRGVEAEARVTGPHLVAFWTERDALARDLLLAHQDRDALGIADDTEQTEPAPRLDAAFLAGWISLRRLHDPASAETRFTELLASPAAITRSRGAYWVGRARLDRGDLAGGRAALLQASLLPTTFYGQLALARLQEPPPGVPTLLQPAMQGGVTAAALASLHDPGWTRDQAIRFAGLELARAAELLVAWNDPHHARAFLLRLDQMATSDTDHALAASLADRLGLPDVAVAIARASARRGLVLSEAGWPRPYTPPEGTLPTGLALGIMRQESSFDPGIVSPAGASGLMQLTLGTARDTARTLGQPPPAAAALFDPSLNVALGTRYLDGLLTRYGGIVPYAVAAYNAGPHRVDRWLVAQGDPARAPAAGADEAQARMVDWIEMIPFSETRNYVQRVIENMGVYQARPAGRT